MIIRSGESSYEGLRLNMRRECLTWSAIDLDASLVQCRAMKFPSTVP